MSKTTADVLSLLSSAASLQQQSLSLEPSSPPAIRELLQPGYETRVKLTSFIFDDHMLLIQEPSFIIDENDEEHEIMQQQEDAPADEKEMKGQALSSHQKTTKTITSALHQPQGFSIRQSVVIADMFKSTHEIEQVMESKQKGYVKQSHLATKSDIHSVLVQGETGNGKTTFSKYVVANWLNKTLWSQPSRSPYFAQLFWLTLRDITDAENLELFSKFSKSTYPLAALIHYLCFNQEEQQKIGIKAINQMLNSQETLIIMDGLDEVSHLFSDTNINFKPLKSLLRAALSARCYLIVTSRDNGLPLKELSFDRHVINHEFSDEQVMNYIKNYFLTFPKADAKLTAEVQSLVKSNMQLWPLVHNPLTLALTCDSCNYAKITGKKKLAELTIIDLYNDILSIFIRRYLDWKSKVLNNSQLSLKATEKQTLEQLIEECDLEIDFLQTLCFLGIEQDQPRFDKQLKSQAIKEVESRYPSANKDWFDSALRVGLLREIPGPRVSLLNKVHEVIHQNFRDYLAARHLVRRLTNYERKAYQWLQQNKYHPRYHEMINLVCALMPAKDNSEFWEILLYEQTDVTGAGHLQLQLSTLRIANYGVRHHEATTYLETMSNAVICHVKTTQFSQATWLKELMRNKLIFKQLPEEFFNQVDSLVKSNQKYEGQLLNLLQITSYHAGELAAHRKQWLWSALLKLVDSVDRSYHTHDNHENENSSADGSQESQPLKLELSAFSCELDVFEIFYPVNNLLLPYLRQAIYFDDKDRSIFLKSLLTTLNDKEKGICAAVALGFFAKYGSQLEKRQVLAAALELAKRDNEKSLLNAGFVLRECIANSSVFSIGERQQFMTVLCDIFMNSKKRKIRLVGFLLMDKCIKEMASFTEHDRKMMLKALLSKLEDHGKKESAEDAQEKLLASLTLARYVTKVVENQPRSQESRELFMLLCNNVKTLTVYSKPLDKFGRFNALQAYVKQTASLLSPEENRILVSELIKLAKAGSPFVASNVLKVCAANARYFSKEDHEQILDVLKILLKDKYLPEPEAIQLSGCFIIQTSLSVKVKDELLKSLWSWVNNQNPALRIITACTLGFCAAPLGYQEDHMDFLNGPFFADEVLQASCRESTGDGINYTTQSELGSTRLLPALLQLMKDGEVWVRARTVDALVYCAAQLPYLNSEDRNKWLMALLHATEDKETLVRLYAVDILGLCAPQAVYLLPKERSQWLQTLISSMSDSNFAVRHRSRFAFRSYVAKAAQYFLVEDLNYLLTKALSQASSAWFALHREEIYSALAICATQHAAKFSEPERRQWLTALLKGALDSRSYIREEIIESLNSIPSTYEDWLSIPYSNSYNELKALLTSKSFRALSLEQLLRAYFNDTATWIGGLKPRRELWLKFIVARIAQEGTAFMIQEKCCLIFDIQYKDPISIPFSYNNRASLVEELAQALAQQTKHFQLPFYTAKPSRYLPIEKQIKPSKKYDGAITALQQDKDELKREVKEVKTQIIKHQQILNEHENRLNSAESRLSLLDTQYKAALETHKQAISALSSDLANMGISMAKTIDRVKESIQRQQEELGEHLTKLNEVTEKIRKLQAHAGQQNKDILNLQKEQEALKTKCKEEQERLAEQFEQLSAQLKANMDDFEKADAKRQLKWESTAKSLQEKQQMLEKAMLTVQQDIEELQKVDDHHVDELQKLQEAMTCQQKLMPMLETVKSQFEEMQKRSGEREELLRNPKLARFYRTMYMKLSGFFMVCMIAETGLVKIESNASMPEQLAQKLVGVLGDNIPIPGVKAASSFINGMISWHSKERIKEGRKLVLINSPQKLNEKELALEVTIHEIIRRYGQQICVLTDEGVSDLAECAVNRIAHGIQQPELSSGASDFPLYMVNLLHQVKLKQGRLGHKDIATLPGIVAKGEKPWNEDGIFRRTGIHDGTTYYYSDKEEQSLLGNKPICRYQKYAFRGVGDAKLAGLIANQQFFEKTSQTLPAGSFQFPINQPVQHAVPRPQSMFADLKRAGVAVAQERATQVAEQIAVSVKADPMGAVNSVISVASKLSGKADEISGLAFSS